MSKGLTHAGAAGFVVVTLALALAAGLCFRPPFDDEAIALVQFERLGMGDLLRFYLGGGDVHPPLAFAVFKSLSMLGVGEAGLRLVSLLAVIAAFVLVLDLALRAGASEQRSRTLIATAFVASPMLFGIGDAIRWYSLFALLSCWTLHRLLVGGRTTTMAGTLLGLAASTSFLAIIPAIAIALWRYGWRRQRPDAADVRFWSAALLCGAPGLVAFANSVANLAPQLGGSTFATLAYSAAGYLGGMRLGLLPVLLALPVAAWLLIAAGLGVRRLIGRTRTSLAAAITFIALAQAGVCLLLAAAGFDKPRSFLFVAPWSSALLAGIVPLIAGHPLARAAYYGGLLLPVVAVLGTVRATDRPFKREMALPIRAIVQSIVQEAPPPAHVISSSPSVGYRLHQRGYCVRARSLMQTCAAPNARPGEVVVVVRDHALATTPMLAEWIDQATQGRKLAGKRQFGHDAEVALKSRLSGVALPEWLIEVEIWR